MLLKRSCSRPRCRSMSQSRSARLWGLFRRKTYAILARSRATTTSFGGGGGGGACPVSAAPD
eukprot:9202564-Alexandrium_andersonii.AAC.1